jgi:hypothetical protein
MTDFDTHTEWLHNNHKHVIAVLILYQNTTPADQVEAPNRGLVFPLIRAAERPMGQVVGT